MWAKMLKERDMSRLEWSLPSHLSGCADLFQPAKLATKENYVFLSTDP